MVRVCAHDAARLSDNWQSPCAVLLQSTCTAYAQHAPCLQHPTGAGNAGRCRQHFLSTLIKTLNDLLADTVTTWSVTTTVRLTLTLAQ